MRLYSPSARQVWLALSIILAFSAPALAGAGMWTSIGPVNTGVGSLALDPNDATTIYAGAGTQRVLRSSDGGSTWLSRTNGLATSPVSVVAVSPAGTLYAGTAGSGVFKSIDRADTWTAASTGLTNLRVGQVATSPAAPNTIYAGTRAGVFKSTDAGGTWISSGLTDAIVSALAADPEDARTVYASAGYAGLYKSTDGGATWFVTGPAGAFVVDISIDPSNPATVYVATVYVATTAHQILRSTDGGATWDLIFESENLLGAPAVDPSDPARLYVGSGPFESLFRSTDGGATWSLFDAGIPHGVYAGAIVFSPAGGRIYAGTASGLFGGGGAGVFVYDETTASCTPGAATLCLNGARFRVQVAWRALGTSGLGQGVPFTADAGYFWFFTSNNVELVIKVVDGRAVNGRFWVFFGAMSDVEYTITVTDTESGASKTYENPRGQLRSVADTSAF